MVSRAWVEPWRPAACPAGLDPTLNGERRRVVGHRDDAKRKGALDLFTHQPVNRQLRAPLTPPAHLRRVDRSALAGRQTPSIGGAPCYRSHRSDSVDAVTTGVTNCQAPYPKRGKYPNREAISARPV